MKSHVIGRLNSIYRSLKIWFTYSFFFETLVDNIKNWYYKVRQLLQNETENSYQKFITKCDRGLLQSASGITKCDRLLLQSASSITKCDRLLLQSVTGITKCDSYYKVRRNKSTIKEKLFNTTYKSDMVKYELKVKSCELRVKSLKAQVKIQKCEFKSTSYEFKSTSYEAKSTSYEFKPTGY